MFSFTCYGWLLFRAQSWDQIVQMTRALADPFSGVDASLLAQVGWYGLPLLAVQGLEYRLGALDLFKRFRVSAELRAVAYGIITYLALFRGGVPQSFIYFQF
jgi:hypothetical protein